MESRKIKRFIKHRKLFNTRNIIIGSTILLGVLVWILYNFLLLPQINLKGKKRLILDYQEKYKEKGYEASYLGKDITKDVKVTGKVKSNKLGTYKITYKVKKGIFEQKVVRIIEVKDQKNPELKIDDTEIYLCPGDEFVPDKVEANDNYDGDLTEKVKAILNTDKTEVTYQVKDSSGNTTEVKKKIEYKDITPPVITLRRGESIKTFLGESFTDPGIDVTDNCDKEIGNKVQVKGSVNTNELGEYTITYEVEDNSHNKTTVSRKVRVTERSGIIYLTFDDGPRSGTTDVILDILKEEGVKATFFVTNNGPDELIKREYDEGHTVALHTATHDYATVYASKEAYFEDLYSVQERVKRITGVESKIIRFPGGSSNTVSRKYTEGIMTYLVQEVQNRGFRYYDWNISSGDAGGTTEAYGVYSNVVNGLKPNRENMILMHDVKTHTRDALREIIRYGKENGYRFEKITMDTEMVTQKVNN